MMVDTHVLDVFDGGSGFASQFRLYVVVFVGFGDLFIEDGPFAGLVTDGPFIHLKTVILKLL